MEPRTRNGSFSAGEEKETVRLKGEMDYWGILFFFHITVLLETPSRAVFLTQIFGVGGGGANSDCLKDLQVGSLAQNSVSISTWQPCLKRKF